MTPLVLCAVALDALIALFVGGRLVRSWKGGLSLRTRLFIALSGAMLGGALATGLYATAVDAATLGFAERFARVVPKGFIVASALTPFMAALAALIGAQLARPVEELSEAAAKIAEGEPPLAVRAGHGAEANKLARALVSMRREIEDKPYAAAFLRDAWHDLKAPVAAIVATLELLEDGAIDDPKAAKRFIENLRRSAGQLEQRLQDLVTLSRYETAAIGPLSVTPLADVIASTLSSTAPLAEAHRVEVVFDSASPHLAQVRARCDEAALSRALENVLDNAIRASKGGTVRVTGGSDAADTWIEVENQPASFPSPRRDHPFQRGVSGTGGGSGLGLAIVRAAVEAQGGKVLFTELGPPRVKVRIELSRA